MLAIVQSAALHGVEALPVTVEVNTGEAGEPRVVLVGLPDAAVKESQDRVSSAITNSGFRMPETRTTINLAPGSLRKEGPLYDLPMALGLLASTGQLPAGIAAEMSDYVIAGELGLSGRTRAVKGALAMAMLARSEGKRGIILPSESAEEAALVEGLPVYPVDTLDAAARMLTGEIPIEPMNSEQSSFRKPPPESQWLDFAEVKGQHALRRAVEVAVAGGHNLLMLGPPGSGKSMIAKRIPSIMPSPTLDEFLQILTIQSVAGISLRDEHRYFQRPYRAPHHTISDVGLLGGGIVPGPGEISLAHHGVLFMDELPEFKRSTLEVLRQPLEDGFVSISRSAGKISIPCSFMLVAAMNPCPCGYLGDRKRECRCTPPQIQRYRARISGPLLDRIDIHVEAPALSVQELQQAQEGESSTTIRKRIESTRAIQKRRFTNSPTASNARMAHREIRKHCNVQPQTAKLLQQAMEQLQLSARAYDRILKVARTIADLDCKENLDTPHVLEAIQYRNLDRQVFY